MEGFLNYLKDNWIWVFGLFFLLLFVIWVYCLLKARETREKKEQGYLKCPLRNRWFKKWDTNGTYTEEYQRIRLIAYFLRRGYSKSNLKCEYPLEKSFGHKGHSKVKIQVDLVVKKGNNFLIVAEVKKNYKPEKRRSAIEHQLKPAMEWTDAKFGIYWDGTSKSCILKWGSHRNFIEKPFTFKN